MAKKKVIDWSAVKADCLAGMKDKALSDKYGIAVSSVSRHRRAEDWLGERSESEDERELAELREESKRHAQELRERHGLTSKAAFFVQEYLIDLNGTQAARRAGYSQKTAGVIACELLKKPNVISAIQEGMEARQIRTQVNADAIVSRLWNVIAADPSQITQLRLGCCRHCWGEDHGYQYIDCTEEAAAIRKARRDTEAARAKDSNAPEVLPPVSGGTGYRRVREPNPDCPYCDGEGFRRMWLADTRHLPPEAAVLFDGVKETKEGIEVKTLDRAAHLTLLMKHLNMLGNVKVEHSGPNGGAIESNVTNAAQPELLRTIHEGLQAINQKLEDEC